MKSDKTSPNQNQNQSSAEQRADLDTHGIDFAPSADEVARRAYFSYMNEGSQPGRDIQHWLEAEAQLLVERSLTRTHTFQHKS